MKKLTFIAFLLIFLLSGCLPNLEQQDEVVQENDNNEEEKAIVPKFQISDSYYKTLTPFKASGARGMVVTNLNTRYESDEFEEGLLRVSQRTFPTDSYIFQEGQYLDAETVKSWLSRKSSADDAVGLNPYLGEKTKENYEANPLYLSHILEHNFLIKTDEDTVKLGGIAIGLALNSEYHFRIYDEQGKQYSYEKKIPDNVIEAEGKKMAEAIVNRLRQTEGLGSVPITIGLYKQQKPGAAVPGNYFAYATAKSGNNLDWDIIDEEYVLFPSTNAESNHLDEFNQFERFQLQVNDYFSNYNGIVGTGLYINGELNHLTIDITMQFNGKAEVIGFSQYLAGLIVDNFPQLSIEVRVSSVSGQEALITNNADMKEPFVHIY